MAEKIQTGLRVPSEQYARLSVAAECMWVSLNSLMLMLIDMGLTVLEGQKDQYARGNSVRILGVIACGMQFARRKCGVSNE